VGGERSALVAMLVIYVLPLLVAMVDVSWPPLAIFIRLVAPVTVFFVTMSFAFFFFFCFAAFGARRFFFFGELIRRG